MTVKKKSIAMRPVEKGRDDAESLMSLPFDPSWGKGSMPQARYVNRRGEVCPGCGNDQVLKANSTLTAEDGIAHRDLECSSCGATWVEQFQVVGFSNFRSSSKEAKRKARRLARKLARRGV